MQTILRSLFAALRHFDIFGRHNSFAFSQFMPDFILVSKPAAFARKKTNSTYAVSVFYSKKFRFLPNIRILCQNSEPDRFLNFRLFLSLTDKRSHFSLSKNLTISRFLSHYDFLANSFSRLKLF